MGRRAPRLYDRQGTWWCWFYDHEGNRVRRSTHQRDRALAREAARRIEREWIASPRSSAYSVEDAIAAYMVSVERKERAEATLEFYTKKGRQLCAQLGQRDVNTLKLGDMEAYQDARKAAGVGRNTIAKEVGLLASALRYAKRHGKFKGEIEQLKPDGLEGAYVPRDRALSREEYDRLRDALSPDRQDYLAGFVGTGARDSELYRIRPADVDHPQKMLHIRGKKTARSDRWIPVDPSLLDVLKRRAAVAPGKAIFKKWGNVRRDLHAACARAGIAPVSPNDLRRTFASWLCDFGIPESVTAQLMGHASSNMVRRVYHRAGPEAKRHAIDAIRLAVTRVVTNAAQTTDAPALSGRGKALQSL